jgi:exosortase E/protease (VPEID-CTERM system)
MDCVALASIPHTASLLGPLAPVGIVFYAVFVGLGYSRLKADREELRFGKGLFVTHLGCIAAILSLNLAAWLAFPPLQTSYVAHLFSRGLLLIGIVLLAMACVPAEVWVRTIRSTRRLWLYASLAGLLAWCLRYPMQSVWDASSSAPGRILQVIAFHSVRAVLSFFLPNILVDPESFTIGTPRFSVIIAEACSGLEGLGLVLVFTAVWLWYFRRESRFPQALLLIPAALLCVWFLNILRIAALVLIGNAGGQEVAMVGFHSQAGWIAFTTVAFCFSMATRKLAWVRRIPSYSSAGVVSEPMEAVGESSATGAYLILFLAILGASFLTKAVSGYFEWLYPLRFVAAAVALWFSWPEIKKLNWRFGWLAPVTGTAVFAVWIAPTFWTHPSTATPLAGGLTALPPTARFVWIAFRIAAATITVPIAEELAFRGYLARRLMNREFDRVPFTGLSALAIGLSSVAFGLMHGQHWIVGIVAGFAYAGLVKWRGRIGDAVVAHATSNLLLAAWVLARGDWSQW